MKSFSTGSRLALAIMALAALPVAAAEKPINLSLFTPISLAKATDSVSGFRFNLIYGVNTSVKVVDLGLINHTTSGLERAAGGEASTSLKVNSAASRSRPSASTRARRRASPGARSTTPVRPRGTTARGRQLCRRESGRSDWRPQHHQDGRDVPVDDHRQLEQEVEAGRFRRGLPTRIGLRAHGHRHLRLLRVPRRFERPAKPTLHLVEVRVKHRRHVQRHELAERQPADDPQSPRPA